jgi:hypothetical protein
MPAKLSATATLATLFLFGAPVMVTCHTLQATISATAAQEAADAEVFDRALEVMNDESLTRQERAELITRSQHASSSSR